MSRLTSVNSLSERIFSGICNVHCNRGASSSRWVTVIKEVSAWKGTDHYLNKPKVVAAAGKMKYRTVNSCLNSHRQRIA